MKKASIKNIKEVINMKKIIKIALIVLVIYFSGFYTHKILEQKRIAKLRSNVIYEITVNVEKINLRKNINLNEEPIKEVYKGETFKVVEYHEGNKYNWYKVLYNEVETGWLASGKENSWVIIKGE